MLAKRLAKLAKSAKFGKLAQTLARTGPARTGRAVYGLSPDPTARPARRERGRRAEAQRAEAAP